MRFAAASAFLDHATVDADALTLRVPSDGSLQSLRDVLERLERESLKVASLSVHMPDLDDVFLAITGQPIRHEQMPQKGSVK